MEFEEIAQRILRLQEKDLVLRAELIRNGTLSDGYNPEMQAIHNSNAKELSRIIDQIGFPTIDKVGEEASKAAWFIVQHSIGRPVFMKNAARLMKKEIENGQADQINFAYLVDRIAVLEGKPQWYGTQFDWDENGEMSPVRIEDRSTVNKRRKALGLNSLEEQTRIMRDRTRAENQRPPKEWEERKRRYEEWRKSVGWIE